MNGNIDESVNNVNNVVNVLVNNVFDDRAMVNTGCSGSLVDNNFCKKHNLCVNPLQSGELKSYAGVGDSTTTAIGLFAVGDARITVPSGFAESKEHVLLQPNTQRKVGLNCPEINKQPISLVDPKDRIGLVCIAQENSPAAD